MIEFFKKKIASYIAEKKYRKEYNTPVVFNKFISKSLNYLLLLPDDNTPLEKAEEIIEFLLKNKKQVSVVLPEHKLNQIHHKNECRFLTYNVLSDISKLKLPKSEFLNKLKGKEFDVLISLDNSEDLFISVLTQIVKAEYRIGFRNPWSDKYYNFQIPRDKINSEISYKNLLNSISKF